MAIGEWIASFKSSLQDNILPVKLVPLEKKRRPVRRQPLVIILLVIVVCSASVNVFLLTNSGRVTGTTALTADQRDHRPGTNDTSAGLLPQKVKFVAIEETDELRKVRQLSREIRGVLDSAARRDIEKVYKEVVYRPFDDIELEEKVADQPQEKQESNGDTEGKGDGPIVDDMKIKRRAVPPGLYKLAPEVFNEVPRKYEMGLKSPCWRTKRGKLRCLPYFFILGMPKCGTTDLWSKLLYHPQIVPVLKEPHWWTRRYIGPDHGKKTFTDYLNVAGPLYKEIQSGRNDVIYGDASASTLWDNHDWRSKFPAKNTMEPRYVNAHIIRELLPDAKMMVILRDPVERLFSDYLFFAGNQSSTTDFHNKVEQAIHSWEECTTKRTMRSCVYDVEPFQDHVRLRLGLYSLFLQDWVGLYSIEHFAIIELSEWSNYCVDILPQIFTFLDVDPMAEGGVEAACGQRVLNVNRKARQRVGHMRLETEMILRNFYKPYNAMLAELLGNENFQW